ncbi:electron transfer flavoprotein subunit beta [Spirochaetia bacterium]|nr:electron transfer flavoprotein subunit beta [Spirochaetia bacterium]
MNMLVCIKQVPDTTEIKIDPVTNTLIRAGVPSIVNTFDAYALELAARIKDANPGSRIVLVSMGPPQAKDALKECLSVGGDTAYLVSDRAFGGSDTLATSYILSRALQKIEEKEGHFDVIFCGKQAIDGDTAQVGPEIAEHLDYPQITYAVEASAGTNSITVKQETAEGFSLIEVKYPCLITVTKPSFEPRYPTIKLRLAANHTEIASLTAADFELDLSKAGLKGSPTKVKSTYTPTLKKSGQIFQEETDKQSAHKLFTVLCDTGLI